MKIMSHVRSSVAAMWILVLTASLPTAFAQQKQKALDELAREADVVAIGRITGLQSEWDEGKTRIFTRVSLSVDEFVKEGSERSKAVTILTPGGEVGDVGELYTHVPVFKKNEEVVVFLRTADRGLYRVAAGMQGKYNIEVDPVTGERVVAGRYPVREFAEAVRQASLK
ncbi:MAG: hypothetical protein H6Q28_436 [Bacteroidetes bacterium]|nr:hypothetical protein [Bacteroidota bacterium]